MIDQINKFLHLAFSDQLVFIVGSILAGWVVFYLIPFTISRAIWTGKIVAHKDYKK